MSTIFIMTFGFWICFIANNFRCNHPGQQAFDNLKKSEMALERLSMQVSFMVKFKKAVDGEAMTANAVQMYTKQVDELTDQIVSDAKSLRAFMKKPTKAGPAE